MAALIDDTPEEIKRGKALRMAMTMRDKLPGVFAKELDISAATMSKWRQHGKYKIRDAAAIASRLGFTEEAFLALGE